MRLPIVAAALILSVLAIRSEAQSRKLSLADAIQSALENNAAIQLAEEQQVQSELRSQEQRSLLLPNVSGTASYVNQTINLGARGIRFPGIPSTVGPFGTSDLRLQYAEPVLDLSMIRRYQAARRTSAASGLDAQAVKNRVVLMLARIYFNVQRTRAMSEAVRRQIDLDNSLLKLARDRQELGAGTLLDVTRAESRLAGDRYRLIQSENDARTAELQLLRAMGERPNAQLELTDPLAVAVMPVEGVEQSLATALRNRVELKAEEQKLAAARLGVSGAKAERLPSVQAFADYGDNGNRDTFVPTHMAGFQVQLPLFDGGRRDAHRKTAESQLRAAEIRAKDVRDEIELDVRVSSDNLASAREQLRAAEEALKLSQDELDLSRVRFEAQVTTQIDVVNAQAQLAEARSRQVNALYALKSAELEYRRAVGMEIR